MTSAPFTVVLPYPPSVNNLYAHVRGRKVLSRRGREYHEAAASILRSARLPRLTGDVAVRMDVYRPRRSGDLDNACKAVLDSVTGIGWDDDRQVVEIHARRFDDKERPRVELTIKPATHDLEAA